MQDKQFHDTSMKRRAKGAFDAKAQLPDKLIAKCPCNEAIFSEYPNLVLQLSRFNYPLQA
ncbi:hypothetical protein GCM10010911_15800 [Paenibacillus nasutitermitis]|uniref:Uncharacterized protein n=1 Tax=Paenibacillus nasutitermitis TaxID=1652958 RepID=A0A917DR61_9BACL|nr:hypothetical protein GCM10010911_15800 [Paenibacillus nasutitermitis]